MKKFILAICAMGLCLSKAFSDDSSENLGDENLENIESVYIGDSIISANATNTDDIIQDTLNLSQKFPTKSVSVINKSKLLESSSGTGGIQSALENVAGITFARSGGVGGQITIRGMNSNSSRSIIAIDGVKAVGRNTLELNMIDPNAIDSIEVIRGAASSLYGSNAINGVINFITRRWGGAINAPFSIDAKVRALEYSSVNNGIAGRAELLGGGDGFDILVGLHGRKGEDFRTPEGKARHSNYSSWGLDWNLGYTYDSVRYYTQGKFQKIRTFNAGGIHSKPGSAYGALRSEDPMSEIYFRIGAELYNMQSFADKMDIFAYLRKYDTDLWIDRRSINSGVYVHNEVYDTYQVGAKINVDKNIQNNALSYGIDILNSLSPTPFREITIATGASKNSSRDTYEIQIAPYIKDDWSVLDSLILSASLRYDYLITIIGKKRATNENQSDSAFLDSKRLTHQGAVTGHLGFVYYFNHLFSISASGSNNFKSPVTSGLFADSTTEANHNIKPEYAQSGELSFRFHSDNHYTALVGYYTNYMNMIQSIMVGNKSKAVNIGKAFVAGVELESVHKIQDFDLGLTLAFTHGTDLTNKKPLAFIAPLSGRITLGYNFAWGNIKWIQRAYLGKYRIDSTQERKSKSYTMSDISLNLKMGYFHNNFKDMELIIGIDNLFNQKGRNPSTQENPQYAYAITNPLLEPGINAFVKLAYKY